jgi:hypothetical protein
MTDLAAALKALARAEEASDDEIGRSVWLAKAADHAIADDAVLVGGAAVNLHTGSYRPTDIDLCAYLDKADREAMTQVGFHNIQGDHFSFTFEDGEVWLLEFPDSQVDGHVATLNLGDGDSLAVISRESLMVDRLLQATDGTQITFDDAVRLGVALGESADWQLVSAEVEQRHALEPGLSLISVFAAVRASIQSYE